ncbi:hypothetical protein [Micromonospora foliorum]|uniref:hypothetical protein n=1 Tax=Micromonospora foliorum TaxID=2911210 RepID=UPI001EE8D160|nr:hypothetical protein [Micromonospora foliorum]MCG5437152.1 hypothetical protein [Micromonospora foliorum]
MCQRRKELPGTQRTSHRCPEEYGDIGRSLLTLFVLLSLETLPDLIEQGMAISPWIALTQRLDDLRAVITELERELRIDREDGHGRPHRDNARAGR